MDDGAGRAAHAVQAGHRLHRAGRLRDAEAAYRVALSLDPGHRDALFLLGNALAGQTRADEAAVVLRALVRLDPDHLPGLTNLGVLLGRGGRWSAAASLHRRAVAAEPGQPGAYANLGNALTEGGRAAAALDPLRWGLRLMPDHAGARFNRGIALQDGGRPGAAVDEFRRLAALHPDFPDALTRLGGALKAAARLDEAICVYDRLLRLRPGDPDARWNRSLALLLAGDFRRGWRDYEARWRTTERGGERHGVTQPHWAGEDLRGRTILLHAEQGLGDTIQFVRYVPAVVARGGRVLLRVSGALTRLFSTLSGVTLLAPGDPVPPFDVHCPLMSLPRLFGTDLDSVPADIPYLAADPALVEDWRLRLRPFDGRRVGLVWAGNPAFAEDRSRSPGLEPMRRLFAVEGCRFFLIQKGAGRAALEAGPPLPPNVHDLGEALRDMADTAAVMANLDLVVSSCTAPIHLAGALGRPGWLALKAVPDWRWLLGRDDSPWYPSLRLFRQASPGDWDGVFRRMADALRPS